MYTLVQEGITPLTEDQMLAVVATVEAFMDEVRCEGPFRFDHLVEAMQVLERLFAEDLGRAPTGLEIMAACCADRKSTRLNSSHVSESRMPSSA